MDSRNHAHKSPWKSSRYLKTKYYIWPYMETCTVSLLYFNYLTNHSIYSVPDFSTFLSNDNSSNTHNSPRRQVLLQRRKLRRRGAVTWPQVTQKQRDPGSNPDTLAPDPLLFSGTHFFLKIFLKQQTNQGDIKLQMVATYRIRRFKRYQRGRPFSLTTRILPSGSPLEHTALWCHRKSEKSFGKLVR